MVSPCYLCRGIAAIRRTAELTREWRRVGARPVGDLASDYSITSSARTSNEGGTERPRCRERGNARGLLKDETIANNNHCIGVLGGGRRKGGIEFISRGCFDYRQSHAHGPGCAGHWLILASASGSRLESCPIANALMSVSSNRMPKLPSIDHMGALSRTLNARLTLLYNS